MEHAGSQNQRDLWRQNLGLTGNGEQKGVSWLTWMRSPRAECGGRGKEVQELHRRCAPGAQGVRSGQGSGCGEETTSGKEDMQGACSWSQGKKVFPGGWVANCVLGC